MSFTLVEYLQHILQEIEYLIEQSQGLNKDEFMQDETLKRAFVRSLEIIGEATKNIPQDFRQQHPSYKNGNLLPECVTDLYMHILA